MEKIKTRDKKNNSRVRDVNALGDALDVQNTLGVQNAVPESSTERLRFLGCRKCTSERFCCVACQTFREYAEKVISIEHRVIRGEVRWDMLNENQYKVMEKVLHIWKHSADMTQHAPSQMALGMVYEYGYGVPQSDFEAVKWYQQASDKGLTEAQARLAKMLRDGRGTKRPNDKKALTLFRDAARGGNAEAFFNIGKFHQSGRAGLVADEGKAVSLMKAASKLDRDFMRSQTSMGMVFLKGKAGHGKDEAEAAKLFTSAANQGYARAQYNLGLLYDKGMGVERNARTAAMWFRKAADQGHAASQHNLALRYMQGVRSEWSPKDHKEAVHLFKLASSQMYAPSLTCLGICFENGIGGVEADVGKGMELCHQAIDEGYFKANPHLKRMRTKQVDLQQEEERELFGNLESKKSSDELENLSLPSITPSVTEFLNSGKKGSSSKNKKNDSAPDWEGLM